MPTQERNQARAAPIYLLWFHLSTSLVQKQPLTSRARISKAERPRVNTWAESLLCRHTNKEQPLVIKNISLFVWKQQGKQKRSKSPFQTVESKPCAVAAGVRETGRPINPGRLQWQRENSCKDYCLSPVWSGVFLLWKDRRIWQTLSQEAWRYRWTLARLQCQHFCPTASSARL